MIVSVQIPQVPGPDIAELPHRLMTIARSRLETECGRPVHDIVYEGCTLDIADNLYLFKFSGVAE